MSLALYVRSEKLAERGEAFNDVFYGSGSLIFGSERSLRSADCRVPKGS